LYEAGERTSQYELRRKLNAIKRTEFPWMLDYTKCAPQQAIINLGKAFDNFFAGRAKHPRFHKKGVNDSFCVSSDVYAIDGNKIRLPKIGWVKMAEPFRYTGAKLQSAVIKHKSGKWYVSISCDVDRTSRPPCKVGAVGVDMGVREHALSTGEKVALPRAYRNAEKQLRRAQKSLSRKKRYSANYRKAKRKVERCHVRIANIRNDFNHKLSARLVRDYSLIGIEDLSIIGMKGNKRLSKSVTDASMNELRRRIEYKSEESGSEVIAASRWFPSSKTCSTCGAKAKHMPLSVREWDCPTCGAHHDRDVNAAINLLRYALENTVSSTVSACEEFFASVDMLSAYRQATSTKQESTNKPTLRKDV
jgi:putative transposase